MGPGQFGNDKKCTVQPVILWRTGIKEKEIREGDKYLDAAL